MNKFTPRCLASESNPGRLSPMVAHNGYLMPCCWLNIANIQTQLNGTFDVELLNLTKVPFNKALENLQILRVLLTTNPTEMCYANCEYLGKTLFNNYTKIGLE